MICGVPAGPDEITADWLSDVVQRRVTGLCLTRIGEDEGFTGGGLYRLSFDGGESLVAKLSPADPGLRATMARANAREVAFYTRLARGLPVPACHHAAFDPATGASVLVLQDLADFRRHNFVKGWCLRDARAAVAALARVHAAWWGAPEVAELQGAALVDEFDFPAAWGQYPERVAQLLPGVELPPAFLALGDCLASDPARVFGDLLDRGPLTALHRDCQVDNVMFGPDGAALLLDWQMMGRGRGAYDLAYALISSLPPVLRRSGERALVGRYHAALVQGGVAGYGLQACRQDYLRSAVSKLCITVVATVLLDNSGPAKTAWRRADLERLLAFCADHAGDLALMYPAG